MQLLNLPSEILKEIFGNLDYISLTRCLSVCWSLRTMISHSSELIYIIELGLDGMMENRRMNISHAEALTKLRERRKAWNSLTWKMASVIPLQGLCHAYELVGGLFMKSVDGRDFFASWLPSTTSDGHQLHRADLKIRARDFATDPGQDLIIFLEEDGGQFPFTGERQLRLYIRSILTHEVHPKARHSILQFFIPPSLVYGTLVRTVMLQIADDIIAVLLSTEHQRLLLWNWKQGFLISDSAYEGHSLPEHTCDFSFISSRAYILTSLNANGRIHINTFESEEGFCPIYVACLSLPELEDDVRVGYLSTHTGPFEVPARETPFTTSPESRIHVLSIQYVSSHGFHRYCLFVHNRTFMSYITTYVAEEAAKSLWIPWFLWGPRFTRLFVEQVPFTWLRYVHGQRVVCPQAIDASFKTLQVLDFNVNPRQLPQTMFGQGTLRTTTIEPSTLPPDDIFQQAVTTGLPYVAITRAIFDMYSAYMIDEERIIGLKAEGPADEELKELHVYTF